ncbi:matrixin family metalloprotease [Laceyella putida]|uniref:Matrixin family metalloprotease n=1 Tax=Laceyella putida TaxID=110101 RepID=A0ABW2RHW6_9BACL
MKKLLGIVLAICLGLTSAALYTSNVFAFSVTSKKQCSDPVYFRWGGSISYNHQTGTSQAIKNWHAAQTYRNFVGDSTASGVIDSYREADGWNGYAGYSSGGDNCMDYWIVKLNQEYTTTYEKSIKIGGHELGHILGLDDNNYPTTLMYKYTPNVSTPQEDDINGLDYIY